MISEICEINSNSRKESVKNLMNHDLTPKSKNEESKKRKAPEDKLIKSRERNRVHARKTRERKKIQMTALKQRIENLNTESKRLRMIIDERYTARLLIGLSQGQDQDEKNPKSSIMLCNDSYNEASDLFKEEGQAVAVPQKRVRRHGKYTQQERDIFRRERNRMHAKRTRDRKKMFFEISEKVIVNMENEAKVLRDYLVSINVLSAEQVAISEENDNQFRITLAKLKKDADQEQSDEDEGEEGEDFEGEGEGEGESREGDNEELNSEDNERVESSSNNDGSWNGSIDGSNIESSNGSSSNGETSGESRSNNSASNSTDGSDKQDVKDNDSDNNGSKSPIDDDMQFQDHETNNNYDSNHVNKSTLDAHNSKHTYLTTNRRTDSLI